MNFKEYLDEAKEVGLKTLYAKAVPTKDDVILKLDPVAAKKKRDIEIYSDPEGKELKATFRWDKSNKPRKNTKVITLNSWKWKLEWIK
jgi:hypothetical protein